MTFVLTHILSCDKNILKQTYTLYCFKFIFITIAKVISNVYLGTQSSVNTKSISEKGYRLILSSPLAYLLCEHNPRRSFEFHEKTIDSLSRRRICHTPGPLTLFETRQAYMRIYV